MEIHSVHIDLCGLWRFQPDAASDGVHRGYFRAEYDVRRWRTVNLPASFEACLPDLEGYEGDGWFRRDVTIPADWCGRRVAIRFAGVNYHAAVWVNGHYAGDHDDGFLPFEFAIQDLLRFGEENKLVVRADNLRRKGEVPGLQRGWRPLGGILREIDLVATDMLHLDHVSVVAEPTLPHGGGTVALRVEVRNGRAQASNVSLAATVSQNGAPLCSFTSTPQSCAAVQSLCLSLGGAAAGVKPWSPDEPNLYDLRVELRDGSHVVDERTVRIGFRRIEIRDAQLHLNGKPIYLTGFNRHEDSPLTGMCPDPVTTRQDLLGMKAAGCNFIRLCHYPHHVGELDLCDELGLLAMDEIPLFWWDGLAEGEECCALKLAAAKRQVAAMIRRDINHPSIIFWSVSNETHEQRAEVVEGNTVLLQHARSLDPTRLVTHASNHWREGEAALLDERFEASLLGPPADSGAETPARRPTQFVHDDVICVNAYPSLNKRGYGGNRAYDFAQSTLYWCEQMAKLHEKYPHKPIMVSEFGYTALEGVFDSDFGEETQAEAITHEFAGMDAPYVCGAVLWCWAAHARPQTGFCRNMAISPYGVLTRDRRKLQAYWTVQKLFREKQGMPPLPGDLLPGDLNKTPK